MKCALVAALLPALGFVSAEFDNIGDDHGDNRCVTGSESYCFLHPDIEQDWRNIRPDPDPIDTCFHPPLNRVINNPWMRWPLHAHKLYAELMFKSINNAPKDHTDIIYEIHPAALVGSFIWV